jgi:hypothetical protein
MLFQFEVTRFPYNNNSPSSSRGRRIYYATPLPECEQLNFFFRRRRRRGTPSVLAASAREIRFKKALDFGWRGALFFAIFPIFFFFLLILSIRFHISTLLLQPRAHIAEAAAAATTPPAAAAEARE